MTSGKFLCIWEANDDTAVKYTQNALVEKYEETSGKLQIHILPGEPQYKIRLIVSEYEPEDPRHPLYALYQENFKKRQAYEIEEHKRTEKRFEEIEKGESDK